jgi:hypothetical protein
LAEKAKRIFYDYQENEYRGSAGTKKLSVASIGRQGKSDSATNNRKSTQKIGALVTITSDCFWRAGNSWNELDSELPCENRYSLAIRNYFSRTKTRAKENALVLALPKND